MESTASTLRLELPRDLGAPGQVREALRQLDGAGWVLGDAMLVASELVNYVVLCSGVREDKSIEVLIELGTEALEISVFDRQDRSGATPDERVNASIEIGMQLVRALSRSCEMDREGERRAWAQLALP